MVVRMQNTEAAVRAHVCFRPCDYSKYFIINTFSTNVPFLYPLKTGLPDSFRGYRNGKLAENVLNIYSYITLVFFHIEITTPFKLIQIPVYATTNT